MILPEQLRDIILKSGFITPSDFDGAVKTSQELGKSLTDILIYRGLISEDVLGQLIAEYYSVSYVKLSHKIIPQEVLSLIPEEAATSFRMIPFSREADTLFLAMEDPSDLEGREFAKRKTGLKIQIFFATPADLSSAIGQYKRNIKDIFKSIISENISKTSSIVDVEKLAADYWEQFGWDRTNGKPKEETLKKLGIK